MVEDTYKDFLDSFVAKNVEILKDNLVGVYLHGSYAMGCFNPHNSDFDFLIVVVEPLSKETKREYLDACLFFNKEAPEKGIELSIVLAKDINPFKYPTPFLFHFSIAHIEKCITEPDEYVEYMHGTDKDIAAHVMVTNHRGIVLYGKAISEVFGQVSSVDYLDSVWSDVENAGEEIIENKVYIILNLCRVLAFKEAGKILSKQEGGNWAKDYLPPRYRFVVSQALLGYEGDGDAAVGDTLLKEFAGYMLSRIAGKEISPLLDELPRKVVETIGSRTCELLIDAHVSGDAVYRVGDEYILKISSHIKRLKSEKKVNDFLQGKVPASKSVSFEISGNAAYYIKTCVEGEPLLSKKHLENPELLIKLLGKALKMYHGIDTFGCKFHNPDSEGDCFVHGDFCLPNILVKDGEIAGFIDTEASGLGDPWVDYAWCIWSLEFNLGTNKYTPMLLKELGIEFDKEKFERYTTME